MFHNDGCTTIIIVLWKFREVSILDPEIQFDRKYEQLKQIVQNH